VIKSRGRGLFRATLDKLDDHLLPIRRVSRKTPDRDFYPRPTNGILVAMTVWNRTFASSGRFAM
jgi:hypothetical protein